VKHAILPAIIAALLLWGCDKTDSVSGTNDETSTSLGRVLRPDGRSAVGARVLLYASGDTQTVPAGSGIVDANGQVVLVSVPKAGYYSLLAKDDSGRALFEDSLVSNGKILVVFTDTVRSTGRVVGRVSVQPQDKPAIAWVQLLGAGRYVNVDDSGKFSIDSVPAGRFTVAALTLTANYTPTFRAVKTISDTTVDVGTIALVYTGIPQVQGVKVTWDSVVNTATVTWNAVSDTVVTGYYVYRGTQSDATSGSKVAYVTSGTQWTDTLFAGVQSRGSLGGLLDSVSRTLWYRVVAVTNASIGPWSQPDSVDVRSSVLTSIWSPVWAAGGTLPVGASLTTLDSLGSGLGVLVPADTSNTLWTSPNGASWTQGISLSTNSHPVFWKGSLWWSTSRGTRGYYLQYPTLADARIPIIDTIVVHHFDGARQDSTWLVSQSDRVSLTYLVPSGDTLALFEAAWQFSVQTSVIYNILGADWKTTSGTSWALDQDSSAAWWYRAYHRNDEGNTDVTSYGNEPTLLSGTRTSPLFVPKVFHGNDTVTAWSLSGVARPTSFTSGLVPPSGVETWTLPSPYRNSGKASIVGLDTTIALVTDPGALRWAPVSKLSSWHRIAAPASGMKSIQIWRGKLWVSDGTSLWSAPVPATL
jgi:hypothetical protein